MQRDPVDVFKRGSIAEKTMGYSAAGETLKPVKAKILLYQSAETSSHL